MSHSSQDGTRSSQEAPAEDISDSIMRQMSVTLFACGGAIGIESGVKASNTTKPIQIRFGDDGEGRVLTLPCDSSTSTALDDLLALCSPASFGRGKEEVMDESYHKASELDTADFTTSFCPYETCIIDVITQLLLPNIPGSENRGVRAELYKLNVYSAPSGKFKAHVDTPRGDAQFGSLVVCLPLAHQDGQLAVRHGDNNMNFDWSIREGGPSLEDVGITVEPGEPGSKRLKLEEAIVTTPMPVRWAAFCSDCEHEVQEVTSGHRLTLTYNLYITSAGSGALAGQPSALDPTQLSFYKDLKAALQDTEFYPDGRVLGVGLSHAYAHTSSALKLPPTALKGSDMYLYEACRAIGLSCHLKPVMSIDLKESEDRVGSSGEELDSDGENRGRVRVFAGNNFKFMHGGTEEDGRSFADHVDDYWPCTEIDRSKVTWLRPADNHKETALAYLAIGWKSRRKRHMSLRCLS